MINMERFTQTEVKNLQPGDRFFKLNDKNKIVHEIIEEKAKVTHFQTYKVFAKRDNQMFASPMKSNTVVVFLRHGNAN